MPVPDTAAGPGDAEALEEAACLVCGSREAQPVATSRAQMWGPAERFQWRRCRACGLVYLSPRVPAARIGRYYEGYIPHRGPEAWGRWAGLVRTSEARTDQLRLARIRTLGPVGPGQAVLDVGCGRPSFLKLVRQETGARCVGTDFDDGGWREAPAEWPELELHAGELERLPLAGPFDRITLWHVLEHLYDPVGTLRHLRTLADARTRLVIEVPDHAGLSRRLQGDHWAGYHTPRHTAAYTPATLRQALERAGWRVVQQQQWGTLDPWVLWWLGQQERGPRDWSDSLEGAFLPFVAGKVATLPLALLERWVPLGFQTAIAAA